MDYFRSIIGGSFQFQTVGFRMISLGLGPARVLTVGAVNNKKNVFLIFFGSKKNLQWPLDKMSFL